MWQGDWARSGPIRGQSGSGCEPMGVRPGCSSGPEPRHYLDSLPILLRISRPICRLIPSSAAGNLELPGQEGWTTAPNGSARKVFTGPAVPKPMTMVVQRQCSSGNGFIVWAALPGCTSHSSISAAPHSAQSQTTRHQFHSLARL